MIESSDAKEWAREQLASAEFGDARRRMRCESMLRRAAEQPAGRLTEVFDDPAELQAAYNFVEGAVRPRAIIDALAAASLRAVGDASFAYAVIDGTSLSLTDRGKTKDFGSVGSRAIPTRGLKVIDALAVDAAGAPIGLLDVHVWARGEKSAVSRFVRRDQGATEVRHWIEVIDRVAEQSRAADVTPWFVIDREGDASDILRAVSRSGGFFTVRVAQRHHTCIQGARRSSLIQRMARRSVVGSHLVAVRRKKDRAQRLAALDIRIGRLVLDLPDRRAGDRVRTQLETNVVWARERGAPHGEESLDWMLFTNRDVGSYADAIAIIESYCHRWRVEDFHRTWKRGRCRVEETQLRRSNHVVRWATMLAAVAARIERLKHLARTQPDSPATIELRPIEIEALKAAKRTRFLKRTETIPDAMPTIATAVFWIAQFGGYQGKPSERPGSITIGRGLQKLLVFTAGYETAVKALRK